MTLLTPAEAAAILRTSPDTVTGMLRGGALPGLRLGRKWLIPADALEAWVRAAVQSPHGTEAPGERQRGRDRVRAPRPAGDVGGRPRRRLDTRRKTDPPRPLGIVAPGGGSDAR